MSLANVVVIGAQWGDEGKGKITDLLSRSADVVVRYQGGVNAGHTIVVDDQVLKLHLIPSGILYPDTICLIGSGTVVDPKVMLGELDMLIANGIDISGLKLSSTAHVTMPYHRLLDEAMEKQRGDRKIGTTGRGIGPTYADKSQRSGIRVIDLLDEARLRDRLDGPLKEKNQLLQTIYGVDPLDAEDVISEYLAYGKRLAPHVWTAPGKSTRPLATARTSCSRVLKAPCSISITAPIPTSRRRTPSLVAPVSVPAWVRP